MGYVYLLPRDAMLALVLAMARCFVEADGRMELVFGMGAFSTYHTLCFKEIRVPPTIRVLPHGTLPQSLDLKKVATIGRATKRAINSARERWTLRA